MSDRSLLEIDNVQTSFRVGDSYYAAVDGVSLNVERNEVLAIVGESGSGKSALAFSIMGLHNSHKTKIEGSIRLNGKDVNHLSTSELNKVRGKDMGMIFQEPLTALNPLKTIKDQITEALDLHTNFSAKQQNERALHLLNEVGIPRADKVMNQYPHELSGGMRQRVVIAIAISCDPSLLIADEPTTALDATIQSQILDLLNELKEEKDSGIILITHDLGVVAEMADRVAVMYAGQVVELADVMSLFKQPKHPYTRSLLSSVPSTQDEKDMLHVIQGVVPSLPKMPRTGCRFKARIPWMADDTHEENPELREVADGHYVRCTCYKHFYFPEEEAEKDVAAHRE
ncbi:peptide/nickel transport system ATP-binding protein [Salsuginibacillus halophilus]|uniref:Peptide/nickel transport system ATP-binding protein n=1 Tax=Salsuginibacillus halophilus TaxID=517424 RepID=A0A2P8HI35_9BACI|nr:ABC transporter ATP-binding protein [Salsuginibacillus halophilus]PSL45886.1 peptide/nickel transport system ATP-binding protein [Salsuginibacillus halophilus]